MLSTLDPHSILMDPEQARDMDAQTSGKFGGLGIVIRMVDKKLTVIKPMKDTPASRAGIRAGDHIVKINNEPTENLTSNEAVDRMRGDPKTGVTLWIERKGPAGSVPDANAPLMRFDLIRDVIRITQVEHKLLDHGVGYIKVKQFSKGIASDVGDAMKEMSAQGASSWILDLRYNPGGLLDEAVQLADLFVDSGTVVTTVSGRDRDARRAERGFGDTTSSLAVLVNGGSASASEIVAGALKNLDRAVIIGRRTFGKGSVQELYDNEDKSKLKLTIAQYLTPGDRSIQNLGIVPDILLQRMIIPAKNDSVADQVHMLPPTHTYGEKDLDAHLVSTYAKDTDKPEWEVPYVYEEPKPAAGTTPSATATPPSDDDEPDADEITEDFEMRFAKELVSSVTSPSRPKLAAGAQRLVTRVRAEEEKKLIAALDKIGVDWTAPTASDLAGANLEMSLSTTPGGNLKAGDTVDVTATVHNAGAGTAFHVLPRIQADDGAFEDAELPIGKLLPGETKTYTAKLQAPKDAFDRVDRLEVETHEARNAPAHVTPAELRIDAAARPVFSYAYQLIDDGNGDGLVQRGEKYRLQLQLKNTGAGPTGPDGYVVMLRNASGDGVALGKSRFETNGTDPALAPGQTRDFEFPLATDGTLKSDEMVLELISYDVALDTSVSEKLHFKVAPVAPQSAAHGDVTAKTTATIHTGASDDTSVIGTAPRGTSYTALATFGAYTKVKLGANQVGFIASSQLTSGGSGAGSFTPIWNTTPPMITLATKGLEVSGDTYRLAGTATDEQHVEDVYVYVTNQSAKIESRKVFYRSNRGGADGKSLEFASELPLWPGSNTVTVVARSSADVRTTKTEVIYRDPPRTAQVP